jgi:hypothetical protein
VAAISPRNLMVDTGEVFSKNRGMWDKFTVASALSTAMGQVRRCQCIIYGKMVRDGRSGRN